MWQTQKAKHQLREIRKFPDNSECVSHFHLRAFGFGLRAQTQNVINIRKKNKTNDETKMKSLSSPPLSLKTRHLEPSEFKINKKNM